MPLIRKKKPADFPAAGTVKQLHEVEPAMPMWWLTALFLFAVLPLFLGMFFISGAQSAFQLWTYLIFSLAFYSLPLALAWNYRLLSLIYLFLGAGAWVFLAVLRLLGRVPVEALPEIAGTSNVHETIEYISATGSWWWLSLLSAAWIFGIVCALRLPSKKLASSWRKASLLIGLVAVAVSMNWETLPVVGMLFPSPTSDSAAWELYPPALGSLGKSLVLKWVNSKTEIAPPFNVVRAKVPELPETHVLIIGESSRWDRWGVNHYARATSPYLSSLPAGELISFSKAHAGANLTYLAVPLILSGIPAENYDPESTVRNIGGLMKEAGFTTGWISSQNVEVAMNARTPADFTVENLNTMGEIGHLFERLPFDGELLPDIRNFLAFKAKRKFVVLHVTGSHTEYSKRYPPAFAKFSSARDGLYSNLPPEHAKVLDAYDNSILYSDWFLGQVIDAVRSQPGIATVTFISDHGESLFDGPNEYLGHGSLDASEYEQHVPLFMWGNDAFRARYGEKWANLLQNRDKPLGSESILPTMADLLDMRYSGQDRSMSFAEPDYALRPSAKVLVNGFSVKPGENRVSSVRMLVPVRVN